MKKLIFLLLIMPFWGFSQIFDDFSDENLIDNVIWSGDTADFEISSSIAFPEEFRPGLRLNNNSADTSAIFTDYSLNFTDSIQWDLWLRLAFNTSQSNYFRFYLFASDSILAMSQNAFFLAFGNPENSQDDSISLCRQYGDSIVIISKSAAPLMNKSRSLQLKIRYDNQNWKVYCDSLGWINYREIIDCDIALDFNPLYSGLFCEYTSSNANKFYIDNIEINNIVYDSISPCITDWFFYSDSCICLVFDEPINSDLLSELNFFLFTYPYPDSVFISKQRNDSVFIYFNVGIEKEKELVLQITDVEDLFANIIIDTNMVVYNHKNRYGDIVINEIMNDPEPSYGLPEIEYLEIKNICNFPIKLENWCIKISSSKRYFPKLTIYPDSLLILCRDDAQYLYSGYGNTSAFLGSSNILANTGALISLMDNNNNAIFYVDYSNTWHNNDIKKDGGWSLEIIDENNICGGKDNYSSSENPMGGTPGKPNTISDSNPDIIMPYLEYISVEDSNTLLLHFSESIDSLLFADSCIITISDGIGVDSITAIAPQFIDFELLLDTILLNDKVYSLTLNNAVCDCYGNRIEQDIAYPFSMYKEYEKGDILINEIKDGNSDNPAFIELYNTSEKTLNMKYLYIAKYYEDGNYCSDECIISATNRPILPHSYLCLSEDCNILFDKYNCGSKSLFHNIYSLPSLSADQNVIALININYMIFDTAIFSCDYHHPSVSDYDNVSLERLSLNISAMKSFNWHSASFNVGYATPSLPNSQKNIELEGKIDVQPRIFNPNNNGTDDIISINISTEDKGIRAFIDIWDVSGNCVYKICNGEMISQQSLFLWDGKDSNKQILKQSQYIVRVKLVDNEGKAKSEKFVIGIIY